MGATPKGREGRGRKGWVRGRGGKGRGGGGLSHAFCLGNLGSPVDGYILIVRRLFRLCFVLSHMHFLSLNQSTKGTNYLTD